MKWSPLLHTIAFLSGITGALALIGAWIAGTDGTFLNLTQAHLYNDTQSLLLVSVAFGIGTLIHLKEESK